MLNNLQQEPTAVSVEAQVGGVAKHAVVRRQDPSRWPVCEEIPWHQVGPLVERVLDEQFGPEKPMVQKNEATCGELCPLG